MSRTFQRLVTIGTALLVSLALALPALASEPVGGTNTNTTDQTASNTAYVSQTALVVSGDATAINGGKAESGDAEVWGSVEQEQVNVQVVGSGVVGACGCGGDLRPSSHDEGGCGCPGSADNDATQKADNYAQASQDAVANTGDAKAVGEKDYHDGIGVTINGGSDRHGETEATSGDTTVKLITEQEQANIQLVLNAALPGWTFGHDQRFGIDSFNHDPEPSGSTATNKSTQTAANTAYSDQAGAGYSGDAVAIAGKGGYGPDSIFMIGRDSGVKAESGDVEVFNKAEQEQLNLQAIVNLAFPWSSDNNSKQKADNYAQGEQGSCGASGDALAVDGKSKAETGEAEAGFKAEQEHANVQIDLTLNGLPVGHVW